MRLIKTSLFFLVMILMSNCGGGVSGDNGPDPFGTGGETGTLPPQISISVGNGQCDTQADGSFTSGETICVRATLMQNETSVAGEIVNFSAGLGALSVSTKLTDANGFAEVTISSDASDVGASTVTATYDTATAEFNYEFLAAAVTTARQPNISISLLKGGDNINRFRADEEVQLQAILIDENEAPIESAIINFSSDRGVFSTSNALTDNQGVAQVSLSAELTDIGASIANAQVLVNGVELVASLNFEIQSVGAINEEVIRIGHFNQDGDFVENEMGVTVGDISGAVEISAGATLGVNVALVDQNDQRILSQTPINFTSTCVAEGLATIDEQVNTINGIAQATFEDASCAGGDGNTDVIVASVLVNNSRLSLSRIINILPESIGSIEFISAQPEQIVLQGTGGQNSQTISTLVFQVNGELGNPLPQQSVDFSLNTETGGLSLSPLTGISNSQGQVSTRVTSGNVPTSVRVTASSTLTSGQIINTQSDLLSVNTGLPDQNSFTLSADVLNPEAFNISGQTVNLVVRLADTFNNPVPDGTSVSFTAEGGSIEPSCTTTNGNCGVIWTSANPRPADHRVTILATAIGHETLFDANGNNVYEDSDGPAIIDFTDSGFGVSAYGITGFVDHSEAWRDDDADGVKDPGEIFLDYNNDEQFNGPDGLFNGPQCITSNDCGEGAASTLHVRKSLELVMSSSSALLDVLDDSNDIIFSNHQTASQPA